MKKKRLPVHFSPGLWLGISALLLSTLGLLFVFESSVVEAFALFGDPYYFLRQHAIGLAAGLVILGVVTLIPAKLWIKLAPLMYIGGLGLLVSVFIPGIGLELNGAHRWINIGPITVQPVEFFKIGLVCYFASWLSKHQRLPPFLFLLLVPLLLIILQPDMGSMLLVLSIAGGMYFLAGGSLKQIGLLVAAGIPVLIMLVLIAPYRLQRLTTFFNPQADPTGASFHIRQITLALGRGGWFGQGIGNSRQKFAYIPEASTDSIFAIVAEEIGFVGSLLIITLFACYFYFAYKIATRETLDPALQLLGLGLLVLVAAQTILNLSAVVGLVPLTGVPLPFFSYGRSSLIMILLATGILIRLAKET